MSEPKTLTSEQISGRLRDVVSNDDHERGCEGRCYACTCGYDERRDAIALEAAEALTRATSAESRADRAEAALRFARGAIFENENYAVKEGEAVAWRARDEDGEWIATCRIHRRDAWRKLSSFPIEPLYTHPAPSVVEADALSRATSAERRARELEAALKRLVNAQALAGVRDLVAGWNGENRADGPHAERHPAKLGATLPKTNCGAVYELDEAMVRARAVLEQSS
jgi:hypothetical protein